MRREESYIRILESSARIQLYIAQMLQAKAVEAERSRNWLLGHMRPGLYMQVEKQLKDSLQVHEQVVELIDGITKVEQALAANMKVLLGHEEEEESSSSGGLESLFGSGGSLL